MACFTGNSRNEVFVLWKTLEAWGDYFYETVTKHQRLDSLETFEYIMGDEDNMNEEYFGIDRDLLENILKILEKRGKCQVSITTLNF